jgi:hypothetical protein
MENKIEMDRVSSFDMAGLIIIVLIFLYFPYKMISEHLKDNIAKSYYTPYKVPASKY